MTVPPTSGARAVMQSRKYFTYRAGQSQRIAMSFANAQGSTGLEKRIGYFDDNDGIFLRSSSSGVSWVIRSSTSGAVVENEVAQASWNLDTMDGTAGTLDTLDISQAQVLVIDFQWFGVGRVRVGFEVNQQVHYVHEFVHTNTTSIPYMRTGSLPVRYEIVNTATSNAGTLRAICTSVVREGGEEDPGITSYADTGFAEVINTPLVVGTSPVNVLAIRARSSHNRAFLLPKIISLVTLSYADVIRWRLILNPTFGATPGWTDIGQAAQQSISQVPYVSGGHVITGGYISSSTSSANVEVVTLGTTIGASANIAGTADVIALVVQALEGNQVITAGMSFFEIF